MPGSRATRDKGWPTNDSRGVDLSPAMDCITTGTSVTSTVHRISTIVYSTDTPVSPSVISTIICMYVCMHITMILHKTMRGTRRFPAKSYAPHPSWRSSRPRPTGLCPLTPGWYVGERSMVVCVPWVPVSTVSAVCSRKYRADQRPARNCRTSAGPGS
jgi:hypothetical protein